MSQRSRTEKRNEERKQQQQKQRTTSYIAVFVVIALLIVGLYVVSNQPAEAPINEQYVSLYQDIPQGTNETGYPRLGSPNARIPVTLYSSFSCSACRLFHEEVFPALLERVKKGEITLTFVPVVRGADNDEGATRAVLCAYNQNKFWEMQSVFFDWYGTFAGSAFTTNRIRAGASALDVNVDTLSQCFRSDRVNDLILRGQQGISSTPTLRINGVAVADPLSLTEINEAIDLLVVPLSNISPEATAESTAEATPVLAVESTPEVTAESTPEATPALATESTPEATAESTPSN